MRLTCTCETPIMESFMTELKVTSSVGRGTTVHMKRRIIRRGEKT